MMEYITNPAVLTLFGVLMGSGLSLIGNILTQHLVNRKEAQQWAREQAAKRTERELERDIRNSEEIETLYHQSINCLSVYLSTIQLNKKGTKIDLSGLTKDIHNWLSKLVVKRPDERLLRNLDQFLSYPDEDEADTLRKYILEMVKKDLRGPLPEQLGQDKSETNSNLKRKLTFSIDKEFQKSLMIQGIELPNDFELNYSPQDILPKHREKLLEIYHPIFRKIPNIASLKLPNKHPGSNKVIYNKTWEAKVNPLEVDLHAVLNAWIEDFQKCEQEVQIAINQAA